MGGEERRAASSPTVGAPAPGPQASEAWPGTGSGCEGTGRNASAFGAPGTRAQAEAGESVWNARARSVGHWGRGRPVLPDPGKGAPEAGVPGERRAAPRSR